MKYKLFIYSKNNTRDEFEFETLWKLSKFLEEYMAERLVDSNFIEMEFDIKVEE